MPDRLLAHNFRPRCRDMTGLNGYLDREWRTSDLSLRGRTGGGDGTAREDQPALQMDVPRGTPNQTRSRTPSL